MWLQILKDHEKKSIGINKVLIKIHLLNFANHRQTINYLSVVSATFCRTASRLYYFHAKDVLLFAYQQTYLLL